MTREFNQNQRYGSRPPYRGSSSNNRDGAEQPSRPTRPRLNRAMVDRAWENGAPHRHADYKPRHPNETGTTQTNHGPNSHRNWHKAQPSEHSSHDHRLMREAIASVLHGTTTLIHSHTARITPPTAIKGLAHALHKPHNSSADQPPHRDQRGHGNEANTYRPHNGHPNFSHTPQDAYRGRHNQPSGQQESPRNGASSYRPNPTNRVNNGANRTDQRTRSYNQHEAPHHDNRFEGRQRTNSHAPRNPSYPTTPVKQRDNRRNGQFQQFEGDYEQFDHAPPDQARKGRRQEERPPQAPPQRTGKLPEVERHVTPLPDGRVLKGPRPVQRKNAQFWTDISQETEELVDQVQTPEAEQIAAEQPQKDALPAKQDAPAKHVVSSRAKAAKRGASAARKGKTDRPVSSGPKPSQRGFKWPSSSPQS